ncbi:GNAT family N-acetyltransferase [Gymnodinialimonas sp. 2305UL16-5]|uniref:GNAT family N-acetyltransferase n=1 Tax=Gymnodinialimonas mytili TaxID=3126503 RepID=UPI0030B6C9D3
MTQILTTEHLTLRRPGPQDAAATTAFYMSERARMAGGNLQRPAAWRYFAAMLGHWDIRGYGLWAVTRTGEDTILGLVGPYFPDGWPETEIGWLIFDGSEGKGIAYEAAKATITDARTRLGWHSIVSYIHRDNARSISLAERLGCTRDPNATHPNADALVYRHPSPSEIGPHE